MNHVPPRDLQPLYTPEISGQKYPKELLAVWQRDQKRKIKLLLPLIRGKRRLLDLGCGEGDVLELLEQETNEIAVGIDESIHRIPKREKILPVIIARGEKLPFKNSSLDVVLASQVLHEIHQFSGMKEIKETLREIARILIPGGRCIILDHVNPSDEIVTVTANRKGQQSLLWFQNSFKVRDAEVDLASAGRYRISKQNLQDFLTKTWCQGYPIEKIEMEETHCCWTKEDARVLLEDNGFELDNWIEFGELPFEGSGISLVDTPQWKTKFIAVTTVKE